jgi:hypothetical protein
MRDDEGRRHTVIGWNGQFAVAKDGKKEYRILKLDLELVVGQNTSLQPG